MKRPLRNNKRRKTRHQKLLRDQRQRALVRGQRIYAGDKFLLGLFLRKHLVDIFFIMVLVAGVWGVSLLGPDRKAMDEMASSVSSEIEPRIEGLNKKYLRGYKIIVLTKKDVIHTSFDTLPEDLRINWKEVSVSRIEANALGNRDERIKIVIPNIDYVPAGVFGLELTASFTRKKGIVSSLARFGDLEFIVEILEDNGEQLFCLFGLREI